MPVRAAGGVTMDIDGPTRIEKLPKSVGNFELLVEEELEFAKDIRVAKWRSKETGMKVVWADVEGLHLFPSPGFPPLPLRVSHCSLYGF